MTAVFVNNNHTTQCVYMEVWETGGHRSLTRDRKCFSSNHLVSFLNNVWSIMFCSEISWKSARETKHETDIGQYVDACSQFRFLTGVRKQSMSLPSWESKPGKSNKCHAPLDGLDRSKNKGQKILNDESDLWLS